MKSWLFFALALSSGCQTKTQSVSALDSTCTACHANTLAHAKAVRSCTDCHGGAELPSEQLTAFKAANPKYGESLYQQTMDASHVHPKGGNDLFFLQAGLT